MTNDDRKWESLLQKNYCFEGFSLVEQQRLFSYSCISMTFVKLEFMPWGLYMGKKT